MQLIPEVEALSMGDLPPSTNSEDVNQSELLLSRKTHLKPIRTSNIDSDNEDLLFLRSVNYYLFYWLYSIGLIGHTKFILPMTSLVYKQLLWPENLRPFSIPSSAGVSWVLKTFIFNRSYIVAISSPERFRYCWCPCFYRQCLGSSQVDLSHLLIKKFTPWGPLSFPSMQNYRWFAHEMPVSSNLSGASSSDLRLF